MTGIGVQYPAIRIARPVPMPALEPVPEQEPVPVPVPVRKESA